MRRRDVLSLLGGAAVSWPLGARAQQSAVPVVGFLHGAVPDAYTPMTAAFRKSLSEAGERRQSSTVGPKVTLSGCRTGADLVRRRVSVIFAGGGSERGSRSQGGNI